MRYALRPFVYRRYCDFGAFHALREIKGRPREAAEHRALNRNINIGAGVIRDVECIGQAFRLIRWDANPTCRHDDMI